MFNNTPLAPTIEVSSNGEEIAFLAASIALFSPEASSFTSGYGKNEVEQEMYPRPRRRTRREI